VLCCVVLCARCSRFGGQGALKHLPAFVAILVRLAADVSTDVAQAAVYGLGVAAVKCGAAFAPFADTAVETLAKVINKDRESYYDRILADNAVSALGKVMTSQKVSHIVDLVAFWLSQMPLTEDPDEAAVALRQLCARLEANDASFLVAVNLREVRVCVVKMRVWRALRWCRLLVCCFVPCSFMGTAPLSPHHLHPLCPPHNSRCVCSQPWSQQTTCAPQAWSPCSTTR